MYLSTAAKSTTERSYPDSAGMTRGDSKHASGVARVDGIPLALGQVTGFEVGDRGLDRVRRSEGHVGAEQHVVRTEEFQHALRSVGSAEKRCVRVEAFEVDKRRSGQGVLHLAIAGPHRQARSEVRHHP